MTETTVRKSDRFIPLYFVGFFVVLAIMDGIFVYLATSTHTGVVTEQAYQKGLDYNETVSAAAEQDALGWQSTINYSESGMLSFTLVNASETPVSGAQVVAEFIRPTHNGADFSVELIASSDGSYTAPVDFPLKGVWDVRVFAEWNQQSYQQGERLIIK